MPLKENYRLHQKDTGSTAIQIISLRKKIKEEKIHLEKNKKDIPAKRALLKKVSKEKRFFQYLKRRNPEVYEKLKKELK
jgi:small subunit ribosomal protein S15